MPWLKDWEEACKESKFGKAVAEIDIEHKDKKVQAEIIKPRYGDGIIVWWHTGISIRKATIKEIDSRKKWKPY